MEPKPTLKVVQVYQTKSFELTNSKFHTVRHLIAIWKWFELKEYNLFLRHSLEVFVLSIRIIALILYTIYAFRIL